MQRMWARGLFFRGGVPAVFASLLISACAPKAKTGQWTTQAPTSNQEAGYIVQAENREQVEKLLSEYGGVARELHGETALYEIRGVEADTIRNELPGRYVSKNVYFENLLSDENSAIAQDRNDVPNITITLPPKQARAVTEPAPSAPATPTKPEPAKLAPTPEKPAAIAPPVKPTGPFEFKLELCQFVESGPVAVIRALESSMKLKKRPIATLGDTLEFAGDASNIAGVTPEGNQVMWKLVTPKGSALARTSSQGLFSRIKPDLPGGYQLILVVQDRDYRCDYATVSFGVTVNAPFKGAQKPRNFEATDRDIFKHLAVIGAEDAWKRTKGEGVVIAIVDSGVNYNHPDLSSNILINDKEIPDNGIDDDKNGYIDDVVGWDFAEGDNMPLDDNHHGTHVAGLSASAVSGVAPRAKILPIKALNAMGGADTASVIAGIMYAVDRGATIINASFGSYNSKLGDVLKPALDYVEKKGVLFVAASGNGNPSTGKGLDTDVKPNYPSALPYTSILSVAATDLTGTLSSYSNFGKTSVHIAAPGGSQIDGGLNSANYLPEMKLYVQMSGTSMATPVTAGVAALVKSLHPEFTAVQIKESIIKSGKEIIALKDKISSGKLVDASRSTLPPL